MTYRCFPVLLAILFFFPACSRLNLKRSVDADNLPDARGVSMSVSQTNATLETFKGIGKMHFGRPTQAYSARIAWVGSSAGKLRVELLGAPGTPKAGFSCDGQWMYFYDPHDGKESVKRYSAKDSTLKRFLSIPIATDDVVSILAGRIPDMVFHSVELKRRKEDAGYILLRNKKWRKGTQKIYLDSSKRNIEKFEAFSWNRLVYRAEFQRMRSIQDYRVPERILISTDNGDHFQLDVQRYWVNVPISPDMFVLQPTTH